MDVVPVREHGKKSIIGLKIVQSRYKEETIDGVPYVFGYGADYECCFRFFDKVIRSEKKLALEADRLIAENHSFIEGWKPYEIN
jgi:hypothetical protein